MARREPPFAQALLRAALAGLLALSGACAGPAPATELEVYAAVSLRPALLESQARLERIAGSPIVFNFGASNDLAGQILAARRADLFLSADEAQVRRLTSAGLADPGASRVFLSNRLVIVVPASADPALVAGPEDLAAPAVGRLSIADPDAVPAGRYARSWLEAAGLWESLQGRIVPATDARAAVAAVESGGAPAGVVYGTDAALSKRVRVVREIDGPGSPEIRYVGVALGEGASREAAIRLLDHLAGPGAREVFARYGFVLP